MVGWLVGGLLGCLVGWRSLCRFLGRLVPQSVPQCFPWSIGASDSCDLWLILDTYEVSEFRMCVCLSTLSWYKQCLWLVGTYDSIFSSINMPVWFVHLKIWVYMRVFVVLVHTSLCLVIWICVYYVLCICECSCLNLVGTYVLVHAGCYGIVRVLIGMYISVFHWYEWSYVRLVRRFYIWTHQ